MSIETILVTGANGYVAMHIIQQALSRGWNVVGTVRSEKSTAKVTAVFPSVGGAHKQQLSLVEVPDLTKPEYFKPVFEKHQEITAVINAASPVGHSPKDVKSDVVDPAINTVLAVLKASQVYGRNVKRVVHVGSMAAFVDFSLGDQPGTTYSDADWNPITYSQAIVADAAGAYIGSKKLAEKAAWDFVAQESEKEALHYDFVSLSPSTIFGPHIEDELELAHLNESSQMLWDLVLAPSDRRSPFHAYHNGAWVDVRDAATALLLAVTTPEAGGERFLCAQRCHWQLIRDTARRVNDELKERVDLGTPGAGERARETTYDVDGSKVERCLGMKYRTLDESLRDAYEQLLGVEKRHVASE